MLWFTEKMLVTYKLQQHLDYNSSLTKFKCNSTKKPWTEIRTALFYLRRYGNLMGEDVHQEGGLKQFYKCGRLSDLYRYA